VVGKLYDWENGPVLEDHTKKKHEILSEYFRKYLKVRCVLPYQERFKIAIVDGFSGAGRYKGGEPGSPIIFLQTLRNTVLEINAERAANGHKIINVECLLILNDHDSQVVERLRENIAPIYGEIKENHPRLSINIKYLNDDFRSVYPEIKKMVITTRCSNVFFNLDQCGYSHVLPTEITDIMSTWKSAEIILTFMIKSFLTYLSPDKDKVGSKFTPEVGEKIRAILEEESQMNKDTWLGEAESIVFNYLKVCASYVSPFSIINPEGWQYWLMHFATSYRARQVYNNVLHENGEAQAHYGRAGLNMMSYDPSYHNATLYLFNDDSRTVAKESLMDDIPKLVSQSGDTMSVEEFYAIAYSETPAHSDDIHQAIIDNPELEVITDAGGIRRKPNTFKINDTIRLTKQKIFYF